MAKSYKIPSLNLAVMKEDFRSQSYGYRLPWMPKDQRFQELISKGWRVPNFEELKMIINLWTLGTMNMKERSYYWTNTPEISSAGEDSGYQISLMPIQVVGQRRIFSRDTLHRLDEPGIYRLVKDLTPTETSKQKPTFQ